MGGVYMKGWGALGWALGLAFWESVFGYRLLLCRVTCIPDIFSWVQQYTSTLYKHLATSVRGVWGCVVDLQGVGMRRVHFRVNKVSGEFRGWHWDT